MASFSLKHEKDSKYRSLNSPVFLNKHLRSRRLRAEDWDGCRKNSFEFNQSLTNNIKFTASEEIEKMEPVAGIGTDCNLIEFENDKISKQPSILMPVNTCEASFLSDNLLTCTANFSNSASSESILPYINTSRAIFTIHLPSFQILVVNSAACQLINYSSDELCSMKLESLITDSDKHKLSKLYKKFVKSLGETNGKILDLVKKDGKSISVSICLKKLDNPEKCLVTVEPVDVKTGLISVDETGRILSCDEEIAVIFQYDSSEYFGLNIYILLPAIDLTKGNEKEWKGITKQHITGRTKNGYTFPVSLAISWGTPSLECKIGIQVYPSLSGMILLNKRLIISNFNNHFIKLLFGFSKKEIINQPIVRLIPTFCKDVEFEKTKKGQWQTSIINDTNLSYWYGKNERDKDWTENSVVDECLNSFKSRSLLYNNITDLSKESEWSSGISKVDSDGEHDIKTLYTHVHANSDEQDNSGIQFSHQNGAGSEEKNSPEHQASKKIEKNDAEQKDNIFESYFDNYQSFMVQEGKFLGLAQHSDGSYFDVKYQVKILAVNEERFYCVWLSRDFFQVLDIYNESNLNMISTFHNTSLDCSLLKDSTCSGQYTKPSTASLISQCDENLTAGDYSQCYTNIRQIGKGAFGYVKMAFRNSDGLLVVTKFIKKQSINIRSWVFNSKLNMKIPLEVSLLTTLYHANIVKVLDVFHNDSFVQLVMEKHGAGFDLFEFINRGPRCDEKLKSYIFRQIISAVHYLDSLGILHRDIKDENVIINEKFEVKLIDFGSATFMPPNETFSKFYGTVEYCSPEVLLGNSYKGPELEIWALGVTLYVLAFGENPFCNVEEIIKAQFSIPFSITKELDDLLHQMLEKNVETRITIDKVVQHSWINQSVAVENYRFEEVVKCSGEEAYPPKYVHEINAEDIYSKDSRTYSNQFGDTNNSNGSLQNLTEIDDLDDNFQLAEKSLSEFVGSKTNGSSVLISSTPVQLKTERLCKSATATPMENSLALNDRSYECRDASYVAPRLKNNYLKHFKKPSSSESESDGARGDISDFSDVLESEIEVRKRVRKLSQLFMHLGPHLNLDQMHLKRCCLLEEEYLKTSNLFQREVPQNVKEGCNENGRGTYLVAEDDSDNESFNPN